MRVEHHRIASRHHADTVADDRLGGIGGRCNGANDPVRSKLLDGETIVNCIPDIGFLHTGIEKNMEAKSYEKAAVMTEDNAAIMYLAFQLGKPVPIADKDIDSLYDRYQNVYGQ